MSKKILIAGESWMSYTTHVKGFDSFYTSVYEEGVGALKQAIEQGGYEVDYVPNHIAGDKLPFTPEEYSQYDCVILSDIGSNTLLIPSATFTKGEIRPNRCEAIRDYVLQGGSLLMIGGYMSFCGIDAKTRYGSTAIQEVLPVQCLDIDDRAEHSEGIEPRVFMEDHPVIKNIEGMWPKLLGYNKTLPKEGCPVVVKVGEDPLIAVGEFGKGKTAVFTSDCAPHWGPEEFMEWSYYPKLWQGILSYIINQSKK